jgi:hypothetical protein
MRAVLAAMTLLGCLIASATPALAGWEATEWGMSPEQVEAAVPGAERLLRGETLDGKRAMSREPYQLGEQHLQARYFYDANGLAMVEVDVSRRECNAAVDVLLQRYGNPLRISDQAILRLVIWHDEPTGTRIRTLLSTNVCSVYFERLADYRDVDLANAAQQ